MQDLRRPDNGEPIRVRAVLIQVTTGLYVWATALNNPRGPKHIADRAQHGCGKRGTIIVLDEGLKARYGRLDDMLADLEAVTRANDDSSA